ncbi:hypothetical protein ABEX29_02730 [Brevibacillus porteri]|uniref:hypothetical protein n=1 Tax=Brevibacillus porteri TaxID=2126350 RepID=UPI003D19B51A
MDYLILDSSKALDLLFTFLKPYLLIVGVILTARYFFNTSGTFTVAKVTALFKAIFYAMLAMGTLFIHSDESGTGFIFLWGQLSEKYTLTQILVITISAFETISNSVDVFTTDKD